MKNTMFNSRLTVMAATMISSLLLLTGCEKETESTTLPEGAMKISTEASETNNSTKTTVSDLLVNWVSGDEVKVNGSTLPVELVDGNPYLLNVDNSANMYAGFPAGIMSVSGSAISINYPNTYEYETSGGLQKLDLPMVAYAAAGSNELYFRHANSTIEVRVKNNFGTTYILDSITLVSSDNHAISGTATLNPQTLEVSYPDATEANKKVKMTFGSGLSISNGTIQKVQIPVVPAVIGEYTTNLTIRIAGRPASAIALNNGKVDAAARFVYVNSATIRPTRAKVLPAPCTMNATVLAMKKFYPTFSVSSTKKVYFSKGNLQYIASSGTWQFASTQTESLRSANRNISESYTSPIDLFGWGTGDNPTKSGTSEDYSVFNEWGDRTLYGSNTWRTLNTSEWYYLLNTRSGNKYVKAVVNSKNGIILFPDNYTPSVSLTNINVGTSAYTSNYVSATDWTDLEAEGCIFLPVTSYRWGTSVTGDAMGYYWSSTEKHTLFFDASSLTYPKSTSLQTGCAVRLVQNAN